MNLRKAFKNFTHTVQGGRKGFKGRGKRISGKARRRLGKALCGE